MKKKALYYYDRLIWRFKDGEIPTEDKIIHILSEQYDVYICQAIFEVDSFSRGFYHKIRIEDI